MSDDKIAIIGDGGWGTALALLLFENGHDVRIWSKFPDYAAEMARTRENSRFLPGFAIPNEIVITADPEEALSGTTLSVVAVPTQYIRSWLGDLGSAVSLDRVVTVAKGLEKGTLARPSEVIREAVSPRKTAVLAGPSHAEEVARELPASVVCASRDLEFAREVQEVFSSPRFRVYANSDPLGVELCGAVKNVVAIAAGISDAIGFGDNAKSALLTRGLVEIVRLGERVGAQAETFYGLAGLGDLITTSISPYGRNRRVGMEIGSGGKLADVLAGMGGKVAEGVTTAKAVLDLAKTLSVEMPITAEVYNILFEDKDPRQAVVDLMMRSLKDE